MLLQPYVNATGSVMQGHTSSFGAKGLAYMGVGPIDLAAEPGECLALLGPSGSGKSLVLRMIADLVPHEGACWLDGADARSMRPHEWRTRVRYSSSEPGWWAPLVRDHFQVPQGQLQALARLGLDASLMEVPPDRLSTGERQRLAFLRSIESRPRVLLLDEPTSALDSVAVTAVEGMIADCQALGTTVILTSHDPAQIERLAHSTVRLEPRE